MEKFFRSKNFARILAIFLALILWLFVTGDKITQTTPARKEWRDVPLRVENLNPDYVVTEIPSSVDMTLEGLPEAFEDLGMDEMDAFVDLSGKEPGSHLVRVQGRPPRGLSLVQLEPEQVRVTIEAYLSQDFPVELDLIGEPAENWELVEYTLDPETVLVGGPESAFERVSSVEVIVDKTGMRLVERLEVQPEALDEEGIPVDDIVIDPAAVEMRLEFERREVENQEND